MCLAFVKGMSLITAFHNRNWCRCTQVAGPGGQVKGASLLSRFWRGPAVSPNRVAGARSPEFNEKLRGV